MKANERVPGLDALRVIASVSVFLWSCLHITALSIKAARAVSDYFDFGIPLFFALSAFSLMYATRSYQGSPFWIERFYIKRFFRIAPLYYVLMIIEIPLLHFVQLGVFPKAPFPDFISIFLNFTFLFGASPIHETGLVLGSWPVGVGMLFYLVFPFLLMWRQSFLSVTLMILATTAIGELMRPVLDPMANVGFPFTVSTFNVLANLRYFAFGMLAFLAYDRLRVGPLAGTNPAPKTIAIFHLACLVLSAVLILLLVLGGERLKAFWRLDTVLSGMIFAVLIVWSALAPRFIFAQSPVRFFSERSYSLFLFNLPLVLLLAPFTQRLYRDLASLMGEWAIIPALVGTYAPIVVVSAIAYAAIEKPGMDLGERAAASFLAARASREGASVAAHIAGSE